MWNKWKKILKFGQSGKKDGHGINGRMSSIILQKYSKEKDPV